MKWTQPPEPDYGTQKTVTRFLWFPLTLPVGPRQLEYGHDRKGRPVDVDGRLGIDRRATQTRWLERAAIVMEYRDEWRTDHWKE